MVDGAKVPPLLETLLALDLDQRTAENALVNSKVTANLPAVVAEAAVGGCDNSAGKPEWDASAAEMVNGEKAPPLLQLEALLALGLDQRTSENTLLDSKVTANLAAVLAEAGIGGCNKCVGNLLYAVATKYPSNALVHRPTLISYIVSMKIKNPAQLDAALSFLADIGPDSLDTGKFEEACGVGVVVSFEEIQSTVCGVLTDNMEAILEQRYHINVGSLCSQVQKRHPWGDAKATEKEVKRRLTEMLGLKAEADNVKPVEKKEKPAKVEEKKVAVATAAISSSEGLNLFNNGIGIRGSGNSLICVDRLEYHTREQLDKTASRSMVVLHPLKVVITNLEDGKVIDIDGKKWPDAPADEASSYYKIPFSNIVYIERTDFRLNDSKDYYGLVPGKSALLRHAFPIKCTGVIYGDDPDDIVEIRAEYDPSKTSNPKGVLHWVAQPAPGVEPLKVEIRLFEKVFLPENSFKLEDLLGDLNPHSKEVVKDAYGVSSLATAVLGDKFQFERLGYFAVDTDSTPQKLVFSRICCLNEVESVNMQASEMRKENREQRSEDLQQEIKLLKRQVADLLHEKKRLENQLAARDNIANNGGVKVEDQSDIEDLMLKLLSCHDYFCCEKDQAAVLLANHVVDQVFVDLMEVPGAGPQEPEHEVLSFIAKLVALGMTDVVYRLNLAGISLNGNFSELDFYWLSNKKVKLGLEVKARAQLKSDAGVNKDYAALHKSIKNIFKSAVVRGTKFPLDFKAWLHLMASPDPGSKKFLIRYNISLMDELGKKNHFLTMLERFKDIIAEEIAQNKVGVLKSDIVLAYIVAAECDWEFRLHSNRFVKKVHDRNDIDIGKTKDNHLPFGSIISRKKLLEKWRHSLVHLHEYSIEHGTIQYHDIHHVQMLESCVQGVFSQFQEGMDAIGELEYPHLVAALKV